MVYPETGQLGDPIDTADIINRFFTQIGANLASVIPGTNVPGTLECSEYESDDIGTVTPQGIVSLIKDLDI